MSSNYPGSSLSPHQRQVLAQLRQRLGRPRLGRLPTATPGYLGSPEIESARKESIIGKSVVRVPWVSWGLLTMVTTLVAFTALWVALSPTGDQTHLIGRSWEQFALQDPEVAYLFSMDLTILGFLGAGFGLIAAVVSVIPYRRGERWAWYALWLFPVTIGGVAARMLIDQYPTGYYYAGITTAAVVGLLLPIRNFLRPRE